MTDRIDLTVDDRVATITFDDPDRLNPLTREAYAAVLASMDEVAATDVRCLVVEGAGDAFSAGGDVDAMGEGADGQPDPAPEIDRIRAHEQRAVERLLEFPIPTVAKVDGPAVADGACLAVAADVTLASERARIGFTHARFGLSLDAGASYLLPRLVGRKRALELALTGDVVDAERAEALGLVNRVYPTASFEERANAFVRRIASGPPLANRHVKRLVRAGRDRSLEAALDAEAAVQAAMFATEDHREGVRAFREDREPEFTGR